MILCVGASPALDRTVSVERLQLGEVHRALKTKAQAGGKAANVARTLKVLETNARLLGGLGGAIGEEVAELAAKEGLDCRWSSVQPTTRVCMTVVAPGGEVTDFNEGAEVDSAGWERLLEVISEESANASAILVSGSVPSVASRRDPANDILDAISGTAPIWIDTSGPALRQMLDAKRSLSLVKVNQAEATAVLGQQPLGGSIIDTGVSLASGLSALINGAAVVTLGAAGAVYVDGSTVRTGELSVDGIVNPTGSGDAFFAGLASGILDRELDASDSLRLAMACGASNARNFAAGQPVANELDALIQGVQLETNHV